MGKLYLGTSGFSYRHWRSVFYPNSLPPRQWLEFYSRHFNSLEINSSFYRLPAAATLQNWYRQTPVNFRFSIKAPRLLTHYYRLKIGNASWKQFWARMSLLKEKLAVILWQLPLNLPRQEERLRLFLQQFSGLARFAFEFRHSSWFNDKIYSILRHYQAALVWHDNQILPQPPAVQTANFIYIRFHGVETLYNYRYSQKQLALWAKTIKGQLEKGDIFAYFNNDPDAFAIKNAHQLQSLSAHKLPEIK